MNTRVLRPDRSDRPARRPGCSQLGALLLPGALLGGLALPAGAQLLFAPPVPSPWAPFAASPRAAAGDVDGDGFADLVVGHAGAPGLRLGDGTGALGPETPLALAASGSTVTLADMNGDGAPDLLVGSSLTGMFHVAVNAGGGSFGAPATYVIGAPIPGQNRLGLNTADADGDGDIDLLAIVGGEIGNMGQARLYRNLGSGTLGLVVTVASFSKKTAGGFPANLNGDNLPDMVLIFDAGLTVPIFSASAMLCKPDATFYSLWGTSTEVPRETADFDGDGDNDLLVVPLTDLFGPPPGVVRVLLNAGDGSFETGPETPLAAVNGVSPQRVRDFDADGQIDLLAQAAFPPELWMLRGQGDGSFASPGVRVSLSSSTGAGGVHIADFDGDGRPDVTCDVGGSTAAPFQAVVLNRTYPADGPLLDLGHALKGAQGWPIQVVEGSFVAGEPFSFALSGAPSGGLVYHVVGFSALNAPFKGGVMVPLPNFVNGPWAADAGGALLLAGPAWPAGPSGLLLVLQFWFADAGGPAGFAASSAVALTVP